jgi:hypothetical protein
LIGWRKRLSDARQRLLTVSARLSCLRAGIVALGDATRALRGHGAARRAPGGDGSNSESERSALIELAALEDRLRGFADDQREDDWADFWITPRDVESLRAHIETIAAARGISPVTIPALRALADAVSIIAQHNE